MNRRGFTIWEEYGITLEEYARAFNKALDEAFERMIKGKVYLVSQDGSGKIKQVMRIINIKVPE